MAATAAVRNTVDTAEVAPGSEVGAEAAGTGAAIATVTAAIVRAGVRTAEAVAEGEAIVNRSIPRWARRHPASSRS